MIRYLVYIVFIVLLISCDFKKPVTHEASDNIQSYSNSYQPPAFINDQRKQIIKDIAPAIQKLIEEHAHNTNIPGIAYGIVVDDSLLLASATGLINLDLELPATINSSFRIASMTKSFTAMAILKLRDEGKLKLEDLVSDYIPEMANLSYLTKDAPAIDIQNLLTMTTGFPEDNPWGDRQLEETDSMLIALIAEGVSFSNVPSLNFEYSNTGYALLGNIVSRVSGMPYQEYIQENILLPLEMKNTYWEYSSIPENKLALGYRWEDEQWKSEPMLHDGSYGAMGGLITSIEDFGKYVSFHLSAWPTRNGEDEGPVKRSSIREMHTPQFSRLNSNSKDLNGELCPTISGYGYGLGISRNCEGKTWIQHGGALPGFGSNFIFFPEYGIGLMAFCNLTYTSPWPLKEINKLLFESSDLQTRQLPVSEILEQRQKQIVKLIQTWDSALEAEILAENFYMDESRDQRMEAIQKILDEAGTIVAVEKMEPFNQLRGTFNIQAENGVIDLYFTLSPEKNPKVQYLDAYFKPKEK